MEIGTEIGNHANQEDPQTSSALKVSPPLKEVGKLRLDEDLPL